jgi:hypothetical protein
MLNKLILAFLLLPSIANCTDFQADDLNVLGSLDILGGLTLSSSMTATDLFATYGVKAATGVFTNTGAASLDIGGGLNAGTGDVGIIGTDGRIPALSTTYMADLSGANLTGIPNAALVTPVIPSSATGTYPLSISGNATTATTATNNVLKVGDTMTGQLTLAGSSFTVTGAGGLGVTYGVTAGSVTAANFYGNASSATYAISTSSDAYWNAKQVAGNYITSLTGGVTASGPGAAAATVVTNANLTGPITSVGNATTIVGPVPVATVDLSTVTTAIGLRVLKAGDTMTGLLALSSTTNTGNSSQTGPATFLSSVTVVGTMTATNVIGSGSGLTSLNGNAIAAGATVSTLTVTGKGYFGDRVGIGTHDATSFGKLAFYTPESDTPGVTTGEISFSQGYAMFRSGVNHALNLDTYYGGAFHNSVAFGNGQSTFFEPMTVSSSLTVTGASSLNMYALGSSSITINTATYDIPVSTGKPYWFINLSSSTTLSFSNVVAGMDLTFAIKQSSDSKTITWPTSNPNVRWPASGNTLSTTTLKIDMVNIACPFVATECFGVLGPTGY